MAKTITIRSLAAPLNPVLALVEGGSLLPDTTYYYKVFATRSEGDNAVTFSPRSVTASITTTDTKKSIQISWDAIPGYSPTSWPKQTYMILRNTADSFLDSESVLLREGSEVTPRCISGVSYIDTGADLLHPTCNFIGGLPTICITGGTAGDPVAMWDIYQADLAGGWGRVKPALDTSFMEFDSFKAAGGAWMVHANLLVGWDGTEVAGYFKHLNGALLIYGSFGSTLSAYLYWGAKVNTDDPDTFASGLLMVHGPYWQQGGLLGALSLYGLRVLKGGMYWGSYAYCGWNQPYSIPHINAASGEVFDCDFPAMGNGYAILGTCTVKRPRLGGAYIQNTVILNQPRITQDEGLGLRIYGNSTITEPTVTYASQDIIWNTTLSHTIIDGTWLSHNRVDNQPWIHLGYTAGGGGTLTFKNTMHLRVSDVNDNPIAGAAIVIKDVAGTTVASGSTDANGKFNAGQLINRILTGVSGNHEAALEDSHVAQGYITRDIRNPHTLTITADGFQTYQDTITIDRKMDLEVALGPVPPPVYVNVPSGEVAITLSAPEPLEVTLEAGEISLELSEGQ